MKRKTLHNFVKRILILSISLLSYTLILSLNPDKKAEHYLIDHWKIADGLPNDMITFIEQTPDGYLWLTTSKGLVRFDGKSFSTNPFNDINDKNFLETVIITTLYKDSHGVLWIGHKEGLISYDYKTGKCKFYSEKDGLVIPRIRHIKEDMHGNLWLSSWSGPVYRLENGKFKVFGSKAGLSGSYKINSIVETHNGSLLFASRENGIFEYRNNQFYKYPIAGISDHLINSMIEDKKGDLWIGTTESLIRKTKDHIEVYTTSQGLPNNHIFNLCEDSEGSLWVGTKNGLMRIKKKQSGQIEIETIMTDFVINCIYEDREKNVWTGIFNKGLCRIKDGTFYTYAPIPELKEEVLMSVFEDKEGLWIGSLDGQLFLCKGDELQKKIVYHELSGVGISAIEADRNGNLWFGTNGKGVFYKKENKLIRYTTAEGLPSNTVASITVDSRGFIWFCTSDGVCVYQDSDKKIKALQFNDGIIGKGIKNIYEDRENNIWIASEEGLTLLQSVNEVSESKPGIDIKTSDSPEISKSPNSLLLKKLNLNWPQKIISGVPVTCVYEDRNLKTENASLFWIATQGEGLKRLLYTNGKISSLTSYNIKNGLVTNSIFQFFEDRHGYFWMMCDNGILRLEKSQLEQLERRELDKINCVYYSEADGLNSREFNNPSSKHSALLSKANEMYFITAIGVSVVQPDRVRVDKKPPPVLIEAVSFNGNKLLPLQSPNEYVLKGSGNIRIRYTSPTFVSPEKIRFKYKLEGAENEWVFLPPGIERTVVFTDLKPGQYTFHVTACNAEGVWNTEGKSVSFRIKQFFKHTLLFKGVITFILIILITAGVYLYKVHPFNKKKKYQGSTMEPQFTEVCIKRLNHLMDNGKIYCEPNLTLQMLAEKLSIQPYQLSQLLNETLQQSFPDYINTFRIEEAKRILRDSKISEMKNTAIAYEVGFNSMTAFYKAFKKYTGMTPTQFKKGK